MVTSPTVSGTSITPSSSVTSSIGIGVALIVRPAIENSWPVSRIER
jgi:hypothetical protein